jgi:hypothetical protein
MNRNRWTESFMHAAISVAKHKATKETMFKGFKGVGTFKETEFNFEVFEQKLMEILLRGEL